MVMLTPSAIVTSPVDEQIRLIRFMLESELGEYVMLYDAESGLELPDESDSRRPETLESISAESLSHYSLEKHPKILSQGDGKYWAVLPIRLPGRETIVAVTTVQKLARSDQEQTLEIQRLEKWCTLLMDRITGTPERSSAINDFRQREGRACAVLKAFDIILRNARLHGEPARFQKHVLKAVSEILGVQAAVSVFGEFPVSVTNASGPEFSPWDCRQLTSALAERKDWDPAGILIDNHTERSGIAKRFPKVRQLIAYRVQTESGTSYLIAINKQPRPADQQAEAAANAESARELKSGSEEFHRSDAAILSSFASLTAAQSRNSHRHQAVKELVVGLTRSLTAAIDAKDAYTAGHSERVARMSVELARDMGLSEERLNDIYLAGLLHDIGKIGIRDEVLGKNGPLTDEEREHINQHVVIGYNILSGLKGVEHLLEGVLYHHEQLNGKGYPEGLAGDKIPLMARIMAVADSFDAMSSDRPYRRGMPLEKVERILRDGTGTQWDPVVIEAFFRCKDRMCEIRQRGIGDSLKLALDVAMRQESGGEETSLKFTRSR